MWIKIRVYAGRCEIPVIAYPAELMSNKYSNKKRKRGKEILQNIFQMTPRPTPTQPRKNLALVRNFDVRWRTPHLIEMMDDDPVG